MYFIIKYRDCIFKCYHNSGRYLYKKLLDVILFATQFFFTKSFDPTSPENKYQKPLLRPPALSVNNSIVTFEVHKASSITVITFYCDIKYLYVFSNPMLHPMFVMRFIIVHVAWMSILQKALSKATTWHAKINKPISDCNWRKQIFFVCIKSAKIWFIPMSLGFLCKSMYWFCRQKGNRPNNEECFHSRRWLR